MLSLFELLAALLTLTALFGWINHRFLRLPANIGMLVMALAASLMLIATEFAFPRTPLYGLLAGAVGQIDFYEAVMHGMLGFLLFAGALHVDLEDLRNRAVTIAILASLGVVISMAVVAVGLWVIAGWLGMPLPFAWCLVFGALIAPTDPVAVLSTLRQVRVPPALRTDMTGESLFNDGVGVVLFTLAVSAAVQGPGEVGVPGMVRLLLSQPPLDAEAGRLDIPRIDTLPEQHRDPLVADAPAGLRLREQGMVLEEAHHVGLGLEVARGIAFEGFLDDRGGRLVALQHLPAAGHGHVLVADRRLEHPVAVHDPGAHAVLHLLAVLLALVLRDAGEQVLDQDRVRVLAELDGGGFQVAAGLGDGAAQF
ncbi:hypothetical protein STVA_27990 [Allostella vacuolata]|nr:hypothetical protein STVA_27990 [Stella vacuolata]